MLGRERDRLRRRLPPRASGTRRLAARPGRASGSSRCRRRSGRAGDPAARCAGGGEVIAVSSPRADPARARRGSLPRPRRHPASAGDASPTSRSRPCAATSTRCSRPSRQSGRTSSSPTSACRRANTDEGIQAAARLRATNPEVGVVVLSQYANPSYVLALLEGGSARRAYLLKERVKDLEQLVAAIHAVAEGGSVIDPKVVEALVAENAASEESPLKQLTPRERDVLREMAEGKNNAAIADGALPDREIGREGDPLDLPQARAHLGDRGPQARQGRDPLPGGER